MGVVLALVAALGVFYLYTALALDWRGLGFGPSVGRGGARRPLADRIGDRLSQAGLDETPVAEVAGVVGGLFVVGLLIGAALFGGPVPALALGAFAASLPIAGYRHRRRARREAAQEAWPRMIEEIRTLTGSVGRSIPQALFEAGRHGPVELHGAFEAAHRTWLLSTDFAATLDVLKARLADPTADATCETLLIAHELGGTDLDQRLGSLAEDRRLDTHDRKDARAKQAGGRLSITHLCRMMGRCQRHQPTTAP